MTEFLQMGRVGGSVYNKTLTWLDAVWGSTPSGGLLLHPLGLPSGARTAEDSPRPEGIATNPLQAALLWLLLLNEIVFSPSFSLYVRRRVNLEGSSNSKVLTDQRC